MTRRRDVRRFVRAQKEGAIVIEPEREDDWEADYERQIDECDCCGALIPGDAADHPADEARYCEDCGMDCRCWDEDDDDHDGDACTWTAPGPCPECGREAGRVGT